MIEGNGNIRRSPEGALFGEAHITSASGRVSEAGAQVEEDAADALLTYENFKLDAELAGDTAQRHGPGLARHRRTRTATAVSTRR